LAEALSNEVMNYQNIFYTPPTSIKPLEQLTSWFKEQSSFLVTVNGEGDVKFSPDERYRENFLVWLNILSSMIQKYEDGIQFEHEFCQDLQLSGQRNPPNMRRFNSFFRIIPVSNSDSKIQLLIPCIKDSASVSSETPIPEFIDIINLVF
jgi:hypothetical protein